MSLISTLKQSILIHLLLTITFFTTGLIVNFFQCILYLSVRPFSRYIYRKINYYLCYFFYSQLVFLAEYWSESDLILYIDKDDFKKYYGKEHGYLIMNHCYEIDWLVGWILCDRVGLLGNCKAYVKKSVQYFPAIGWTWKFAECVFLARNWEEDKEIIKSQISELANYPDSIWLLLYPEGTRFTEQKLEASKKFALEKGITPLKHHLLPRTRGFTASIPHMRGKIPAIYDVQLHFNPADPVKPTMTNLLLGKRIEAHLYMQRIPIEEVPEDDEGAAKWLYNLYKKKDRLAESFYQTGDFFATSGVPRLEKFVVKKRCYTCLNTIIWSVIVLIPMTYYLINLFLTGSVISCSVGIGIIFLFYVGMRKLIGMSQISKSSSYGTDKINIQVEKKEASNKGNIE
ncbi:1-acyl-sn-glycerol-3-phosphate acyltransferase gamma [Anthophora retusa]